MLHTFETHRVTGEGERRSFTDAGGGRHPGLHGLTHSFWRAVRTGASIFPQRLNAGFLSLGTVGIWAQINCLWSGHPVHCGVLRSIPGLY